MKFSKLALAMALVTVAGSAAAQSTVTIYGTMDTGLGRLYKPAAGSNGDSSLNMLSGYTGTSLIGFRGSEDLGSGLKVNFQLEGEIKSDDGGFTNFSRQSWVGMSGGFGEFMLGRTTTPQNRLMGTFDLNGTADGSSALKVIGMAANGSLTSSRQSNQVQYATPKMGGFQARVAYAFSETGNPADPTKKQKNFLQVAANYKVGELTLGAAIQPKSLSMQAETLANDQDFRTGYALGAKYNFGLLEASVLYTRNEKKTEGDGWGIGVAAPVGKAWKVGAQFARLTSVKNLDGSKSAKQGSNAYELFANYSMSKRTSLYMAYGSVSKKAENAFALANSSTYAVGITHKF